jgi:hypothetical protein
MVLDLAEEPGRSPGLARAVISSFLASDCVRGLIAGVMQEGRGLIAEIISAGQARGEIDPRVRKEKAAFQLQQAVMGTFLLWSLDGEPALRARVEDSFEHFWRAVAIRSQKQEP